MEEEEALLSTGLGERPRSQGHFGFLAYKAALIKVTTLLYLLFPPKIYMPIYRSLIANREM